MEWALEIALIVLLATTLFHALRLERALGVLKRDRVALEQLVVVFNQSTQLAEQGIDRLRNSAEGVGRQMSRQIDVACGLKNDLLLLSERGERLADRLEQQVRSARSIDPTPAFAAPTLFRTTGSDRVGAQPRNHLTAAHAADLGEHEEPQLRLRSQAERDLLKALKTAR
jgi:hypothetical protein